MEPFISSGEHSGFKRVTDPRSNNFAGRFETFGSNQLSSDTLGNLAVDLDQDGTTDIGLGNPDFTFVSFRSNVVLRWEYVLGSTVFFVWQHGRSNSNGNGQFALGSSLGDLFSSPSTNTFVVKMNYWLSP